MIETVLEFLAMLLYSGLGNLAAYLAAHVLLCLLPAFYIAGAMTALIPKETVTRYLGRNTPKFISYPAAAAAAAERGGGRGIRARGGVDSRRRWWWGWTHRGK